MQKLMLKKLVNGIKTIGQSMRRNVLSYPSLGKAPVQRWPSRASSHGHAVTQLCCLLELQVLDHSKEPELTPQRYRALLFHEAAT